MMKDAAGTLKALSAMDGQAVSENQDRVSEEFAEKFSMVNEDDVEAGYVYILKSKSDKEEIRTIQHLYKIGYSKIAVEKRIKMQAKTPPI